MINPRRTLADFTDAELATMVRNSIYAKHTAFGDGPMECRFLLVLAVPYGQSEEVTSLSEAIDSFHRFVSDDDWKERDFQVYDHRASQTFFSATMEEMEANEGDEDE